MKQIYSAFLLLVAVVAFSSCRKDGNDIDIKTYDKQQIEAYITANNLTGMKRDTVGGDTTGIYYEILAQGKGEQVDYASRVAIAYTISSLDGSYAVTDTISNHSYNYLGSLSPRGLMLAMRNVIKYKGTRARIIIPSRLAYGQNGAGTGSTRLPGNTSLVYYINLMDDARVTPGSTTDTRTKQDVYDELSIRKYAAANGIDLSTYTHEASGLFWKRTQPDTGKVAITPTSSITLAYTGTLLNGTQFDQGGNDSDAGISLDVATLIPGFREGVTKIKAGGYATLLIPSTQAYGYSATGSVVAFSCLRFDIKIFTVTN